MDEIDQAAQQVRVGLGKHAVAEVEDVSWSTARLVEDGPRTCTRRLPARDEASGIEVPLDAAVVADPPPGVCQ